MEMGNKFAGTSGDGDSWEKKTGGDGRGWVLSRLYGRGLGHISVPIQLSTQLLHS